MTTTIRLGVLRLTDSAPAILAEADGAFTRAGLDVRLHIEPSWANIADKLAWGLLDAAILLSPLAIAMVAGLRGTHVKLRVPMGISRGGNAIVARPDVAPGAAALAAWIAEQHAKPRFAVVHAYSTHNLLLREALAAQGLNPDTSWETVSVPPQQVVAALAEGTIDGFCAGAPWGDAAEWAGAGRVVLGSSTIRPGHAEKCLALTEALAATPHAAALCTVLRHYQERCADPAAADSLARLLATSLDLPEEPTRATLRVGAGREPVSFTDAATIPRAEIDWMVAGMVRWGWIAQAEAAKVAAAVFAT